MKSLERRVIAYAVSGSSYRVVAGSGNQIIKGCVSPAAGLMVAQTGPVQSVVASRPRSVRRGTLAPFSPS